MRQRAGQGQGQDEVRAGTAQRQGYMLPVDALLLLLAEVEQATLASVVPVLPGQPRGRYPVMLVLRAGVVVGCQVTTPDGRPLLVGEDALTVVREQGELAWQFSLTAGPQPFQSERRATISNEAGTLIAIPRRTGRSIPFAQLPTRMRQVLNLVDGSRTLLQIAQLLHRSTSDVSRILHQAHQAGWIDP